MEIKIMRADEIAADFIGKDAKIQISRIFVEGFSQWLTYFSKDESKLMSAFEHMFQLDSFYVAVADEKIIGITACTDGKTSCVRIDSKELRKHLGFFMGSIASMILKNQFENHPYPFKMEANTGSIEFVATGRDYRGKGIASSVITHIIENTPYDEYVLEVADTNENAFKLYTKLGFKEFMRVKMKDAKRSGINFLVYMKNTGEHSSPRH